MIASALTVLAAVGAVSTPAPARGTEPSPLRSIIALYANSDAPAYYVLFRLTDPLPHRSGMARCRASRACYDARIAVNGLARPMGLSNFFRARRYCYLQSLFPSPRTTTGLANPRSGMSVTFTARIPRGSSRDAETFDRTVKLEHADGRLSTYARRLGCGLPTGEDPYLGDF